MEEFTSSFLQFVFLGASKNRKFQPFPKKKFVSLILSIQHNMWNIISYCGILYCIIRYMGFVSQGLWKYIQPQKDQQPSLHLSPRYHKNVQDNEKKCATSIFFWATLSCEMSLKLAHPLRK